ncbi:MAG: TonB-dependent receptor [Saprospiraceae bacterium]|nr:TonB-dependent receptor [Saprospiraceae bacterium]
MFHFAVSLGFIRRSYLLNLAGLIGPALFFHLTLSLSAQSDTTNHQSPINQSTHHHLSEVVVQATRTDPKSPVPHSNFSAEKIASQYHAQDIPYLLSSVPSLVETSDGGIGTGYTGLRIRGSDPTRINVTINGLPLNDAESQGLFWVDLPDLATSAVEIQVQRGVGASTNGAGAFGASVNLNLSKVENDRFASVSNTLGSFGTRKHSLVVGTGLLNDHVAFTARVSGVYSDGYVDRASANMEAIHLSGSYLDERQTAQFHLLSGHEVTYQAWNGLPAQYLENESLRTFNSAGMERPGTPHPDEVDHYTQRHFLAHYKRVISSKIQLQLNGHYTKGFGYFEQYKADQSIYEYGLPLGLPIDTVIPPMDLVRRRWLDNDFYGGTFALRWLPVNAWKPTFLLGGALNRYEGTHFGEVIWAESFTGASNDFRYYENTATKNDANVFLKIEASPAPHFSTFLDLQIRGIRYDFLGFDNELNNVQQKAALSFFNPKIGATYSFSDHWSAYAFLGVGHREPNRDDFTQSTPDSRPSAEKMLDLESGLRRIGQNWTASANLFCMQYRDQLVLDGRINDVGAYIRTNVPDSWRTGIELEASGQVGPLLVLTGSAAFSRNKIRAFTEYRDNWDTGGQELIVHRNTDLAFSPDFIARGEATFKPQRQLKASVVSATIVGKYVSQQDLDNTSNPNTALPGYLVTDLRLNYDLKQVLGKQLSLIVSLNNFLDKKYASNGWAYRYVSTGYDARPDNAYTRLEGNDVYHQAGFFPQAGRHWMATLRVVF